MCGSGGSKVIVGSLSDACEGLVTKSLRLSQLCGTCRIPILRMASPPSPKIVGRPAPRTHTGKCSRPSAVLGAQELDCSFELFFGSVSSPPSHSQM